MNIVPCIIHRSGGGTPSVKVRQLGYAAGDDRNSYISYTADHDMTVYARATAAWISGGWGNAEIRLVKGGTTLVHENISLQDLDGNKRDKWASEVKIIALKKGDQVSLSATGTNYLRTVVSLSEIGNYVALKQ